MDRFDAMRAFTRIVERRSFTKAADDLGLPRSSVTDAVKALEARLGVRLLQRTTRTVSPTLDGEVYYRRCLSLIADLEDADGAFSCKPSGLVRVDVHGTQARYFLLPGLPEFLQRYPDIRIHIGEAHQPVDMIREGFDCILRAGELIDSPLIRRRLATLDRGTFASPDYIRRLGMPLTVDELEGHRMVGYLGPDTSDITPLAFQVGGKVRRSILPAPITVTGPETNVACACLGLGLIQVPRYRVATELATGALVEVLSDLPPPPLPVYVLYSQTRQLTPRLRVFIDWMAQQFAARLAQFTAAEATGRAGRARDALREFP